MIVEMLAGDEVAPGDDDTVVATEALRQFYEGVAGGAGAVQQ